MQAIPGEAEAIGAELLAGRYRLGERLGAGGMADVFDAFDVELQRPVAVKLLRPEMARRREVRTRFEIEARAAAALNHPNTVAVFDAGDHEGRPFLVMERLPGKTLKDLIAAGTVDPAWLQSALAGVLGALEAAHATGVVHRDVKPGNILLADDGTAKIADFGIAKSLEPGGDGTMADLTRTGELLGTPAYVAPERLRGQPATARSDVYAVGVVAYQALAGTKPFTGDGPMEVARCVAEGRCKPLAELRPDLDPALVAVVEKAMERDPRRRFASATDMAAALRAPRAPAPAADPDPTVSVAGTGGHTMALDVPVDDRDTPLRARRHGREGRRRRRLALPAGVGALCLLLLLALLSSPAGVNSGLAEEEASATEEGATGGADGALGEELRSLAASSEPEAHGPRADDLAGGLRDVAAALEDADAVGPASALVIRIAAWQHAGDLDAALARSAIGLLARVPGVPPLPEAVSPPPSEPGQASAHSDSGGASGGSVGGGGDGGDRGKGKGEKD